MHRIDCLVAMVVGVGRRGGGRKLSLHSHLGGKEREGGNHIVLSASSHVATDLQKNMTRS